MGLVIKTFMESVMKECTMDVFDNLAMKKTLKQAEKFNFGGLHNTF